MATAVPAGEPTPSRGPVVGDRIRLVLPADPAYGRIARIATAGVALRLGLPFAAIEDLRIAVDEAVILLLGGTDDADAELVLELTVADARLELDLTTSASGGSGTDPTARRRFTEILEGTGVRASVDESGRAATLETSY